MPLIFNKSMKTLQKSVLLIGTFLISIGNLNAASALPVGPPSVTKLTQLVELGPNEAPGDIILGAKRDLYVSFPFLNQVRHYSQKGELLNTYEVPVSADDLTEGLAIKWNGDVFIVVNSFFNESDKSHHGVWKLSDGKITQFASLPLGGSPSEMVFDKSDHLYVNDSILGLIWKIDRKGEVSIWTIDPLLLGNPSGYYMPGLPIGAYGLALGKKNKSLLVGNTDYGRIVRIDFRHDGSAGKISVFAEDPLLGGIAGLSKNRRGMIYATVPYRNAIVSVAKHGIVNDVYVGDPLEFPADIVMKWEKCMNANAGFLTNMALQDHNNPGIFRILMAYDPYHPD
jgi:sugar lactone lactonase YvrE